MARSITIVEEGSYARRKETAAGDTEADFLRRILPPEMPAGKKFAYKWIDRYTVEYGVFPDPNYKPPKVPAPATTEKTAPVKLPAAQLTEAKLKERAAELGIETKGRTREAVQAEIEQKEALAAV